jgi:probable HAF family extracellular repeat protein
MLSRRLPHSFTVRKIPINTEAKTQNMTTYPYRTIDPPGSTYSIAYSINAKGQIVGFYQGSNAQEHGFLDSGGTFATIDPPGSIQTIAYSINAKGQIVGWYFDSSGSGQQGFLDSGGIYTTIDPLGSVGTVVQQAAINDSGQIVGYYNANGTNHGFPATPKKGHEAVLGMISTLMRMRPATSSRSWCRQWRVFSQVRAPSAKYPMMCWGRQIT